MSGELPVPSSTLDLEFADGVYSFHLGLKQIAELQTKCGCGIGALYARVLRGRYSAGDVSFGHPAEAEYRDEDLIETLRMGLIGGAQGEVNGIPVDVTPIVANRLIANYAADAPRATLWNHAAAILHARIEGYVPKKKEPMNEASDETTTATDGSITPEPLSTAP